MKERIRQLRKTLSMTLKEFGDRIHLTLSSVSAIELGKVEITERTIASILAAFPQVNETWLREGTGEMFRPSGLDHINALVARLDLPDIAREVLTAYEALPPEARQAVLDYVRSVVARLIEATGAAEPREGPEEPEKEKNSWSDQEHERIMQQIDQELKAEKSQADGSSGPFPDTDSVTA